MPAICLVATPLISLGEAVADTSNADDMSGIGGIVLQFLPEVRDVGVHRPGKDRSRISPHLFEDVGSIHH